ncbi:MAG: c-type cytochrome domain-containing protein, partial [Gemmataceae bacterium]
MRGSVNCWLISFAVLTAGRSSAADVVDFTKHVRPILEKNCVSCHGATKQKAGLKLDLGKRVIKGGINGPVVVAKKSGESKLVHALNGSGEAGQMPPDGPLPDADIKLIARWIDEGAAIPA